MKREEHAGFGRVHHINTIYLPLITKVCRPIIDWWKYFDFNISPKNQCATGNANIKTKNVTTKEGSVLFRWCETKNRFAMVNSKPINIPFQRKNIKFFRTYGDENSCYSTRWYLYHYFESRIRLSKSTHEPSRKQEKYTL